jgi:hypothetical protein
LNRSSTAPTQPFEAWCFSVAVDMMFLLCFELTEKASPDTGANDTPTPEEPNYDTEEIPDDRLPSVPLSRQCQGVGKITSPSATMAVNTIDIGLRELVCCLAITASLTALSLPLSVCRTRSSQIDRFSVLFWIFGGPG